MSSKKKKGSKSKSVAAVQSNFKEFAKIVSKVNSEQADMIRENILELMAKHCKIK